MYSSVPEKVATTRTADGHK